MQRMVRTLKRETTMLHMSKSIYGVDTYCYGALLVMRSPGGDFVTVRTSGPAVAARVFGQLTAEDAQLVPARAS